MPEPESHKAQTAEERTEEAKSFLRRVRRATRRKYTAEEKIRIVLEGFRREVTVNDLCRREGIKPHSYFAWTKEFMEASKERLARDTLRDATQQGVQALRRENGELKQVVGELSLEAHRLKKRPYRPSTPPASTDERCGEGRGPCQRSLLRSPKRTVLRNLGIPRSTYYRWARRRDRQGLEDHPGGGRPPWNRLTSQEVQRVLWAAWEMPELSCRQLAAWTTDNQGFSVSESTVYRILRREGLVKRAEMRLAAGKEYHRKTTGPHQMWATDASYFRVVGWGSSYLVTVMDDSSRFILAHRLQRDMTADSVGRQRKWDRIEM